MAVAFGSIATATANETADDTTSITIGKPSGLASGDLMIAIISYSDGAETSRYALTGWTEFLADSFSGQVFGCLAKVADASDAAASNFTFSKTGGEAANVCGAILRITSSGDGFDGTANIVAQDSDRSGDQNPTYSGGVTPGAANTLLIMGVTSGDTVNGVTVGSYAVANNNPTWTERAELTSVDGTTENLLAIATATFSVGTATGNYSLAHSADPGDTIGFLFAVNETTNVTVNPTVVTATASIVAPSVSGGANVSVSVVTATASIQAPSVSTANAVWTNKDKGATPTITNKDKS